MDVSESYTLEVLRSEYFGQVEIVVVVGGGGGGGGGVLVSVCQDTFLCTITYKTDRTLLFQISQLTMELQKLEVTLVTFGKAALEESFTSSK